MAAMHHGRYFRFRAGFDLLGAVSQGPQAEPHVIRVPLLPRAVIGTGHTSPSEGTLSGAARSRSIRAPLMGPSEGTLSS